VKAQQTPAAFKALSDPIRLEILDRIAAGSEVTATQLAAVLRITRQAVARHIKMLENAGLVIGVRTGREHRYQLETMPLVKAVTWLQARTASWDRALERLAEHLQGD
jgi:DNA-binding transcriptional ArsR family regulator